MRRIATLFAALGVALAVTGGAFAQSTASVTVVHGVPGLTVDVYVDGELALPSFEPGTVTDPIGLSAGEHAVDIRAAGDPADAEPAISGSATVEAGESYSLVAHLDAEGAPTLSAFVDDVSSIAAGEARLTVRHTAAAPAVDVLANGAPLVQSLANPEEATAVVPSDTYTVAVAPAGTTDPVLGPTDLTLNAGTAYVVYAIGSAEGGSLDLLVQATEGLGDAPAGVPAGDSGLAASGGMPAWLVALLAVGGAGLLISAAAVARARA